ncbi:MAG: anthranilate synthase component I family protein [Sphingobacteriales bacterium]|nr:anthranilate synthase component I family protein [Sphingobacteriales bacterium]
MTTKQTFALGNPAEFKLKALHWANQFDTACYLDSNKYPSKYSNFECLIAAGAEEELIASCGTALAQVDAFIKNQDRIIPGFLSYDLKNELEALESNNPDHLDFPDAYFFKPKHLITISGKEAEITSENPNEVWEEISQIQLSETSLNFKGSVAQRFSQSAYITTVKKLQEHIQQGDIYEVTLCQEFYAEEVNFDPLAAFIALNRISPTPFSSFFKQQNKYILSATPERYLAKRGNKLLSQPIKGTARRSSDKKEDEASKQSLAQSEKERAENVMIVDLVRNDLTRCALPGTVQVEELFGVYSFTQVHQLISTISCQVAAEQTLSNILKATFPMGSMTGAPKIRAMQLIELYERSKRGVYSGSVCYIQPNGDFDFNVIIRSMLYNANTKYLSFQVGGAITAKSIPEEEYEECLLKAKAISQVLGL